MSFFFDNYGKIDYIAVVALEVFIEQFRSNKCLQISRLSKG